MGARNETRLTCWTRRFFVAAGAALVVQAVALLVLDGVAETVMVWGAFVVLIVAGLLTIPVDSARGKPFSWRMGAAMAVPSVVGTVFPQLATVPEDPPSTTTATALWQAAEIVGFLVAVGLVATGVVVVRVHRYRRGPRRTVALRVIPAAAEPER